MSNRTLQQNRALHLMFEQLADELNNTGMTMTKVIKADIPWNKATVKELLWKPIQYAQIGKQSTTELTTQQIDYVFQTLNKALGEAGISIMFPSIETLIERKEDGFWDENSIWHDGEDKPSGRVIG